MLLGIGEQQRHLARQVLDVVHHEGHPPVEFVEAARLLKRFLSGLLGKVTCDLLARHAEQIEILPVEPTMNGRPPEYDDPDKAVMVGERYCGPAKRFFG